MHHFTYSEQERRSRQNPEAILQSIELKEGMTFIDIGCNDGFFTIPAAKMVGKSGKVYGVDIDVDAIEQLTEKAKKEHISIIQADVGEAEATIFCSNCADIVFFGTVLHDFRDPLEVLCNAKRMLKSGGKIVNYDWKKKETPMGPPVTKRLSESEATNLMNDAGFTDITIQDISDTFYQITAIKE